jgi:hypothetical protein
MVNLLVAIAGGYRRHGMAKGQLEKGGSTFRQAVFKEENAERWCAFCCGAQARGGVRLCMGMAAANFRDGGVLNVLAIRGGDRRGGRVRVLRLQTTAAAT